jgi:predicted N-acetyltransferase YhbS
VRTLKPLSAIAPDALETLLDLAFGTDRHGRTAYAVREGAEPVDSLSFVAMDGETLTGSLQCWPVTLLFPDADALSLVMVGPVAVHPEYQNQGIGKYMTREVTARLDHVGQSAMMIGDPDYYQPFGFRSGPASGWTLPGPVEPHRILLRPAPGSTWPAEGVLGPDLLRSCE